MIKKVFSYKIRNNTFSIEEELIENIETAVKEAKEEEQKKVELQQYRLAIPTIESYRLSIDNIGVLEDIDPELEEMLNNGENIVTFNSQKVEELKSTLKAISCNLVW